MVVSGIISLMAAIAIPVTGKRRRVIGKIYAGLRTKEKIVNQ